MNFSISEIMLILLIALLVVKPEQMPGVAYSLGRFVKNMRDMFAKVKDEMSGIVDSIEKPAEKKVEEKVVDAVAVKSIEKIDEPQQ